MDGRDGNLLWKYNAGSAVYSLKVGDINDDNLVELIIGTYGRNIIAFGPLPSSIGTVRFEASQLSGEASGIVLVVDEINYSYSDLPKSFTWYIGTSHSFEWKTHISAGSGKQYVWVSCLGLSTQRSGSITVSSGGGSIMASYKTQYYLTVSSPYGSPTGAGWYEAGATVSSSVTSPVSGGTYIQYVYAGYSGSGSAPASGTGTSMSFTIKRAFQCNLELEDSESLDDTVHKRRHN